MLDVASTLLRSCRRPRATGMYLLPIWLIVALAIPAQGTVRRRLNVRSNPPGALVYVDNQQIGTTPCSVDFIYYGTREIRLIKPGYETLTVNQPIPTPWYEVPGLDFVSEVLVPTKIRDNRTVTYNLAPQLIIPTQEIVDRANQLRQDTLQFPAASLTGTTAVLPGAVVTPPATVVAPTPAVPEPLPGIGPPPAGQPIAPQALPAPQPSGPPVLLPRP
jgi:PEGA domain